MKKKIVLIILVLASFLTIATVVNAAEASYKVTGSYDSTNSKYGGTDGNYMFSNSEYGYNGGGSATISIGDKVAYCSDPGKAPVNVGATCKKTEITGDQAAAYAYIFSNSSDVDEIGGAIRIVSTANETSRFGGSSDKRKANNKCAYVNAAAQAAKIAGTTLSDDLLNTSSYSGSVNCATEYNVSGTKDSEGNSKGQNAITLAGNAMKASNEGSVSVSAGKIGKVTNKDGKVIIPYQNMPEGTKITISCTGGTCSGDVGEKYIDGTNDLKISVDPSECGSVKYSASVTMPGNANSCSKVVQYNCSSSVGNSGQYYIGCDETSDGSGNTTQKIADNELINCKDSGDCPATPQVTYGSAASGLCDSTGTAIEVLEKTEYSSVENVEKCVLEEPELEATDLIVHGNEYCQIYCTEDYHFNAPGGIKDTDYLGEIMEITSGSFFEFESDKISDKTDISCYSINYVNKLLDNIAIIANTELVPAMAKTTYGCRTETDEETGEVTYYQTETTINYYASVNYSSLSIEIKEINPPDYKESKVSSCTKSGTETAGDVNSAKNRYKSKANEEVSKFGECNKWDLSNLKTSFEGECSPTVEFYYSDGAWLGITPIELEKVSTVVEGSVVGKYDCGGGDYCKTAASTGNIDLGEGLSTNDFIISEYAELTGSITNEYSLNSIKICNDYNKGTSEACIPGSPDYSSCVSECTADKGKTLVNGWPISYDATMGENEYQFIVTGFGHYLSGSTCKPGRLEDVAYGLGVDTFSLICPYNVNTDDCADCEWYCDPNGICEGNDDCDEDCIWECKEVGCLFDINNGLAFNYSPISLINPFNLAYLQNQHQNAIALLTTKENNTSSAIAVSSDVKEGLAENWSNTIKGQKALDEIRNAGENIYSDDPEYSITLTPALINDIRRYNDDQEDKGGYLDSSLSCHGNNGSTLHIVCESKFLNEIAGASDFERNTVFETFSDFGGESARKSGYGPAWK